MSIEQKKFDTPLARLAENVLLQCTDIFFKTGVSNFMLRKIYKYD